MSEIWPRPRRRVRPERMAAMILTVLLMLGAAGMAALAVSLTDRIPAIDGLR